MTFPRSKTVLPWAFLACGILYAGTTGAADEGAPDEAAAGQPETVTFRTIEKPDDSLKPVVSVRVGDLELRAGALSVTDAGGDRVVVLPSRSGGVKLRRNAGTITAKEVSFPIRGGRFEAPGNAPVEEGR